MKLYQFKFQFVHQGQVQFIPIQAESVREAKALADSLSQGLCYANDYEEVDMQAVEKEAKFANQQIAWICSTPADELPFPFKPLKKAALFLAYGTDCQCCLGYRIMGGLLLGGLLGYLVG